MAVRDNVSGGGPMRTVAPHIKQSESVSELSLTPETVIAAEPSLSPEAVGEPALRRCRRCFLYEMDGKETYYQSVVRLRQAMPAAERADDVEYDRRLSVCRECPHLDNATCMQCGCYAEVRALKRAARCPMKRW